MASKQVGLAVVSSLNGSDSNKDRIVPNHLCSLVPLGEQVPWNSRYLCDKTEYRRDELEHRLQNFASALGDADPTFDPNKQSLMAAQSSVTAVGRVVCDAESDNGARLNPSSVIFEGCARPCRGLRVQLDLRHIPYFSLFPGQALAVHGDNPSGHCLVAKKLVDFLPPPPLSALELPAAADSRPAKRRKAVKRGREGKSGKVMSEEERLYKVMMEDLGTAAAAEVEGGEGEEVGEGGVEGVDDGSDAVRKGAGVDGVEEGDSDTDLRLIVAAGPFTTTTNWSYKPLTDLLSYARQHPPHLLVLIGPFVDAEHPDVQQGLLGTAFAEVFQKEVVTRIEQFCLQVGEECRVAVVPSLRDAHHTMIFPQPAFPSSIFDSPSAPITCLSNPSTFAIDQHLAIACTSTDILKSLIKEEAARVPPSLPSDRMLRLASHLIAQRSFFPLFPPPLGACLDLTVAPRALDLPVLPHLLLLPSDLVPFAKVLPSDMLPNRVTAVATPATTIKLENTLQAATPATVLPPPLAAAAAAIGAAAIVAAAAPTPTPHSASVSGSALSPASDSSTARVKVEDEEPAGHGLRSAAATGAATGAATAAVVAIPTRVSDSMPVSVANGEASSSPGNGSMEKQQDEGSAGYQPVIINPGRLAKGMSGGTFAEIEVRGGRRNREASAAGSAVALAHHISVYIRKL